MSGFRDLPDDGWGEPQPNAMKGCLIGCAAAAAFWVVLVLAFVWWVHR